MSPQLAQLSDEALLFLVARSDDRALGELYDRYGRVAYGLALRIVRDRALAEDAVQDAFMGMWRTAAAFDPARGKVSSWLLTLVHRRSVDLVRREDRRRADSLDQPPPDATPSDAPPDEEAFVREQRRTVQRALAALPEDQREALELAYYGGLTQSELAQRLGVPLGTVKSRTFAGLARLRELLDEPG